MPQFLLSLSREHQGSQQVHHIQRQDGRVDEVGSGKEHCDFGKVNKREEKESIAGAVRVNGRNTAIANTCGMHGRSAVDTILPSQWERSLRAPLTTHWGALVKN